MRKPDRHIQFYGPGVVAIGAAAALLLAGPMIVSRLSQAHSTTRVQIARKHLTENDVLSQMNDAVQNVARAVEPSVVHITVAKEGGYSYPLSTGSGWIYDDQGHIVTNHHVIAKNGVIEVQFYDGARLKASLVAGDQRTDVAIIRVENQPVIPMIRATGKDVRQGDLVFAFGSPFGLQFSMSTGVVSGQGRSTGLSIGDGGYQSFVQTDAAINPGNSGGPLTNVFGEVIGMNFAMAVSADSPNRGRDQYVSSGVGLAIPLEIVEFVANQIIETGKIERGGLGLDFRDLTRDWQDVLEYHASGVRVVYVIPESSADAAGLEAGDVVFTVDGREIRDREQFRAYVHTKGPGEQLVLGVWRKRSGEVGQELEVAVILGEWDEQKKTTRVADPSSIRGPARYDDLGMTIIELAQDRLSRLGFTGIENGLYIQSVRVGSAADDLGFKAGHLIVTADSTPIGGVDAFATIAQSEQARTSGIALEVVDPRGDRHVIRLRLP